MGGSGVEMYTFVKVVEDFIQKKSLKIKVESLRGIYLASGYQTEVNNRCNYFSWHF